jgi:hypothetical protein
MPLLELVEICGPPWGMAYPIRQADQGRRVMWMLMLASPPALMASATLLRIARRAICHPAIPCHFVTTSIGNRQARYQHRLQFVSQHQFPLGPILSSAFLAWMH